jgi:hypothetical protein
LYPALWEDDWIYEMKAIVNVKLEFQTIIQRVPIHIMQRFSVVQNKWCILFPLTKSLIFMIAIYQEVKEKTVWVIPVF